MATTSSFLIPPSYVKNTSSINLPTSNIKILPPSHVKNNSHIKHRNSYEERNLETDLATHPLDYHGYCHHVRGHVVQILKDDVGRRS